LLNVGIFGAAGYGGIELVRMLLQHPEVEISYVGGHTTVGESVGDFYPHLAGVVDMTIQDSSVEAAAGAAELLFFCLPHAVGAAMVAEAISLGRKVVDFSADYRLKSVEVYEQYYEKHPAPELIEQAVYGLPELHREEIRATQLTATPGCYPTGAILALAPACAEGVVEPSSIIVDSKSGVSGAGRGLSLTTHFAEANESVSAYKVAQHRHTPEMDQELSLLGEPVKVTFAPHLVPITRGILTTAYAELRQEAAAEELVELYSDFYAGERFVQVLPEGKMPGTKQVSGSNNCHIGLAVDAANGRLIAVSAIDNLVKGLAGAAVQCMNLMCGFPEETGLTQLPVWP
jgi:N-acetyl-gamma-glutamyl-phosphate reductase